MNDQETQLRCEIARLGTLLAKTEIERDALKAENWHLAHEKQSAEQALDAARAEVERLRDLRSAFLAEKENQKLRVEIAELRAALEPLVKIDLMHMPDETLLFDEEASSATVGDVRHAAALLAKRPGEEQKDA